MPIYIGENKIVDCYLGDTLLEAVYIGGQKVYDPYTEITGALPLSFNSRVTGALKNYRVYGTAAGAGAQTINLLDVDAKDTANGYVADAYLSTDGSESPAASHYAISEYIPVSPSTRYSICSRKISGISACFYNVSKEYISGVTYTYARPRRFTSPSNAAYLRMTILEPLGKSDMLLKGNYDEEPEYEPFGYKIPLTLTSDQNTDDYLLFIGSTKLGEEEYADFGEQKVYKRTENLWNPAMDITAERYITSTGSISSKSENYSVSDYIPMSAETEYTISSITTVANAAAYHVFYDANQDVIETTQIGKANQSKTFTTPQNCAYARFSFRSTSVGVDSIMLVEGSTLPETFVPYLQPTDPPVPLPTVNTYDGENSLSSTETVGNVTVKGRISELTI